MVKTTANYDEVLRVINAEHPDPFSVLGMHYLEHENAVVVRAFFPNAKEINVVDVSDSKKYKMDLADEKGFFEVLLENRKDFFKYILEVTDDTGHTFSTYDPYCFLPVLTDFDLHLFNEGNHHKIYEKLGAHLMTIDGIQGTLFAVWAPCAKRVSVVGDFNQWDGRRHTMRARGSSGIWELFIPGIKEGDIYNLKLNSP